MNEPQVPIPVQSPSPDQEEVNKPVKPCMSHAWRWKRTELRPRIHGWSLRRRNRDKPIAEAADRTQKCWAPGGGIAGGFPVIVPPRSPSLTQPKSTHASAHHSDSSPFSSPLFLPIRTADLCGLGVQVAPIRRNKWVGFTSE